MPRMSTRHPQFKDKFSYLEIILYVYVWTIVIGWLGTEDYFSHIPYGTLSELRLLVSAPILFVVAIEVTLMPFLQGPLSFFIGGLLLTGAIRFFFVLKRRHHLGAWLLGQTKLFRSVTRIEFGLHLYIWVMTLLYVSLENYFSKEPYETSGILLFYVLAWPLLFFGREISIIFPVLPLALIYLFAALIVSFLLRMVFVIFRKIKGKK